MKRLILPLLLSFPLMATQSLHVDDLIKIALEHSPDINVSKLQYDAADQRTKRAVSNYLPEVNAFVALGGTGASFVQDNNSVSSEILSGSLSASQLIFDFGKTTGDIDAFSYDANATLATLQQTISNKIFAVKNSYYLLLQNRNLIHVYEENVKLSENQYTRSKRYFDAGIRTKIDVSDANVKLIQAQLDLQNAHYDVKLSEVQLLQELGVFQLFKDIDVAQDELNLPYIYKTLRVIDTNVTHFEAFAYTHRYELKSQEEKIKSVDSRLQNVEGDYFPSIYAKANYNLQKVPEQFQAFTPEQQWQATVNMDWNLFKGLETNALSQEATINALIEKSNLQVKKLAIKKEVDDAFINVFKQRDSVKLSQALAIASDEKFVQAEQRYEHGLSDFVELQQARQEYIDSLSTLVTEYYRFYIASAELDRATGK